MQHVQQHHRIHPAGCRHQDPLPRAKQMPGSDVLLDVAQQVTHAPMLFPKRLDARKFAQARFAICHLPFALVGSAHRVTRPVTQPRRHWQNAPATPRADQQLSLWLDHGPARWGHLAYTTAKPHACRPGTLTRRPNLLHNETHRLPAQKACAAPASYAILQPVVHQTTTPFQSVPPASATPREDRAAARSNSPHL